MLQDQISTNPAFPQAGLNSLYFVYLPSGVTVSLGGSSSCQAFCGIKTQSAASSTTRSCRRPTAAATWAA